MPNGRIILAFILCACALALILVYVVPFIRRFLTDWKKTYNKEDELLNPKEKEEKKPKKKK